MSIPAVEALAALPAMPTLDGTTGVTGPTDPSGAAGVTGVGAAGSTQSASGAEFGSLLTDGLDRLEGLQNDSSNLAVKAATGDLSSIHDYTIAAAEASTATQLAVSLRNTGLQAFNQIMSLQI